MHDTSDICLRKEQMFGYRRGLKMKDRSVLHCDLNSYFASVEILDNPALKGKPVAVCGSKDDRHGIVLAKSNEAKKYGVKTGEAIWQAQSKCRSLIIAEPHYDRYMELSRSVKDIYYSYTDRVESFGIDECWLDVTGSRLLFGDAEVIADEIRQRVKKEVGLTISVGVSFNKVFAKLGSDMKKPDAVTVISRSDFREKIWNLPASDMLGVGTSTARRLLRYGIGTIGELAGVDPDFLRKIFGKLGIELYRNANGLDDGEVALYNDYGLVKSVGNGSTANRDLINCEEVCTMLTFLSEEVSKRLRGERLSACGIQITIKDKDLVSRQFQAPLAYPTQNQHDILRASYELFRRSFEWEKPVRALTVRAINLQPETESWQTDIFCNVFDIERTASKEKAMEKVRDRYGRGAVEFACLMNADFFCRNFFSSLPVRHSAPRFSSV